MIILQALYFMFPAYLANMAPVLLKWTPLGNFPLDHKKTWHGQRIFGEHKTYRGIFTGVLLGVITIFVQARLVDFHFFTNLSLIPYQELSIQKLSLIGFAFGFGALLGDLVKSFFKRRLKIPSGKLWFPFDQLDFAIGALLLVQIFYTPPWPHIMMILVFTPLLHFLTNVISYFLGLKKVFW